MVLPLSLRSLLSLALFLPPPPPPLSLSLSILFSLPATPAAGGAEEGIQSEGKAEAVKLKHDEGSRLRREGERDAAEE